MPRLVSRTLTDPSSWRGSRAAADVLIATTAWVVVVICSTSVHLDDPQVRRAALFVHLVSLAVGFGAVVMVDVYGLLWLLGQRTVRELHSLACTAHTVISLGVGGLLASGVALNPDVRSSLARTKLALVLVLMLNGVAAQRLMTRIEAVAPQVSGDDIPWRFIPRVIATAALSQVAWWGTIAIGFTTSAARHG